VIPNQILNYIGLLDPLPVTARKLAAMLQNENACVEGIAKMVEHDARTAAVIVRAANSAAYRGPSPVERVSEAVARLGTANLLTIVLGQHLRRVRVDAALYDLTEGEFHLHSEAAALMIKAMISESRGTFPATASIAALLHDMGKLIMVRCLKVNVPAMRALCKEKKIAFFQAERELLGCDHAEVGAAVARNWEFPEEVVLAIEQHHRAAARGNERLVDAVMLANYATKSIGIGLGAEGFNMTIDFAGSRERLGISLEGFERACAQAALWIAEQRREMQ